MDLMNGMEGLNSFKSAFEKAWQTPKWTSEARADSNRWNPYSFEGGTTAAIAGENFVIGASDSRMTQMDVNILSRDAEKIHLLNDSIMLLSAGFYGDVLQLKRLLDARLHKYRFDYREDMTIDLCGQLLSRNLYYRRFFPYYTEAILAGLDEKGNGVVYGYDSLGTLDRCSYDCSGSAEPLIMPFFDCQIGHVTLSENAEKPPLTLERALSLIKDAFRLAAEREVSTGDRINVVICEKGKPVRKIAVPLRED